MEERQNFGYYSSGVAIGGSGAKFYKNRRMKCMEKAFFWRSVRDFIYWLKPFREGDMFLLGVGIVTAQFVLEISNGTGSRGMCNIPFDISGTRRSDPYNNTKLENCLHLIWISKNNAKNLIYDLVKASKLLRIRHSKSGYPEPESISSSGDNAWTIYFE